MSDACEVTPQSPARSSLAAGQLEELPARLESLAQENEDLGRELLRCYEQLSLVFEITEHIANLRDPQSIQEALLRRYGTMLGAGAIFYVRNGECIGIEPADSVGRRITLDSARVQSVLAADSAAVRESSRARVPSLDESAAAALGGAHVLISALRLMKGDEAEAGVVIALRAGHEPPFDSGDMLASEAVLGYGGHIVSNVLMVRYLQQTAVETVCALANAIDAKDNYTSGHSERVGWLAEFVGKTLDVPAADLQGLEWAGLLHDVGKIGIREGILNKPGKLTADEFADIKKHPRMSYEVLEPVASLEPILDAVLHHHENCDGSGYPDGLKGEQISLVARILHVVDIFDALTSTRSYRKAYPVEKALGILLEGAGRVTDPHVTQAFTDAFRKYMREEPEDFRQRFAHLAAEVREDPADQASTPAVADAGCGARAGGLGVEVRPDDE